MALFAADNQDRERQYVIEQLKQWHSQGYAWDEMAVLARNKLPVSRALSVRRYQKLGICTYPCSDICCTAIYIFQKRIL